MPLLGHLKSTKKFSFPTLNLIKYFDLNRHENMNSFVVARKFSRSTNSIAAIALKTARAELNSTQAAVEIQRSPFRSSYQHCQPLGRRPLRDNISAEKDRVGSPAEAHELDRIVQIFSSCCDVIKLNALNQCHKMRRSNGSTNKNKCGRLFSKLSLDLILNLPSSTFD